MAEQPDHDGFGYTAHGDYRCFCGYPLSDPMPPLSCSDQRYSLIVHELKQVWLTHRLVAMNRSN